MTIKERSRRDPSGPAPDGPPMRRIAWAAFAGSTIEFYDFFIYGTAAALVFGKVFFPALGSAAGSVAALSTFAVAFLARPVGSLLFGYLGDRLGRTRTLIYTLLLMGVSTVGVGLLPGADTIGVAAPILLVALRVLQGIAVGGEWGGAALLVVESAPTDKRGHYGMFPQLGPGVAFALTSATFLVTGLAMSPATFQEWGWRVPFLLSSVLVVVGLYVRLRIEDTPVFRAARAARDRSVPRSAGPLRGAFADRHRILLAGGAMSAVLGLGYIGTVYLTSYGTVVLGLPRPVMLFLGVIGGLLLAVTTAVSARWSDRVGRRRVVLVGNVATIGAGLVAFPILDAGHVVFVGAGLALVLVVSGIALGPMAAFLSELFATRYRYSAAGMSFNLAAVLGGAVPPVLATPLQAGLGSWSVGLLLSGFGVLSTLCVLALPETRGRSLLLDRPARR